MVITDCAHHPRLGASPQKNHQPSHIGEGEVCCCVGCLCLQRGEAPSGCLVYSHRDAVEGAKLRVQCGGVFGDASELTPT